MPHKVKNPFFLLFKYRGKFFVYSCIWYYVWAGAVFENKKPKKGTEGEFNIFFFLIL